MKSLDFLFDKYESDKGNTNHKYGQYYEKHLPVTINKFLEIGTWKFGGLKAFQEWYEGKGEFYGLNYTYGGEIPTRQQAELWGFKTYEGNHDDIKFLQSITGQFEVIVEDGSHHSDSQINIFKQMFVNNVTPNGVYVIEDIFGHADGEEGKYWRRGKVSHASQTIIPVLQIFIQSGSLFSELITVEESRIIAPLIKSVDIYQNKIVFITKHE